MAEVPTFAIPELPPPSAAEPPASAPPPWTPGGWNDPRGKYDRDGPKPFRWGPILVFGILFLVLGGVLVALLWTPSTPPRPALVLVSIWKYTDPSLPPNPWAKRDGERLKSIFPLDSKRPEAPAGQQEVIETAAAFRSFVNDLAKQKSDRPFICFLTALADETPNGISILAPVPGAGGDVTIPELLDGLKACPAQEKLLVLDLARPLTRPVTGPFRTDPAKALHDAITAYGPLPCPVIVSCSPGEVSVPMDPEGNSAFAFYLAEGLRGAADGSDEKKPGRDGRVTVRELFLFTAYRTNRWAAQVRGLTQTPRMYAKDAGSPNFDVFIPSAFPGSPTEQTPKNPMPSALADGWVARDARKADRLLYHPLALAAYEGILLRAEAYWRAGDAERARTEADQPQALKWMAASLAKSAPPWHYPTLSASVESKPPAADKKEEAARAEADAALRKAVDEYFRKLGVKSAKPEDIAPARELLKGLAAESSGTVVRAIWTKLLGEVAPPDTAVKDISSLLVELMKGQPPTVEEALLTRLATLPEDQRIEPKATAALLNTEDAAGRTIAIAISGAFPAVAEKLRTADDEKRQAEANLFKPEPSAKEKADAIDLLKRVANTFAEVRDRAEAVQGVRVDVREALWLLTATAPAAGEDDAWFKDWKALADALTEPVEKIFVAVPSSDPADEWRAMSGRIKIAVARLRKRSAEVPALAKKIAKDEVPDVTEIAKLRIALLSSSLPAADRAAAWDAIVTGETVLHKKVRDDLDEKENASPKGMPHAEIPLPEPPDLDKAARRRVEVSLTLARIGGLDLAKYESTWKSRVGTEPKEWTAFGAEVRAGWGEAAVSKRVAEIMKSADGWPMAERIERAIAPQAAGLFQPEKFPGIAPAERSARATAHAADGWLEQHFRAYQLIRPRAGDFYPTQVAAAARRARQSAE